MTHTDQQSQREAARRFPLTALALCLAPLAPAASASSLTLHLDAPEAFVTDRSEDILAAIQSADVAALDRLVADGALNDLVVVKGSARTCLVLCVLEESPKSLAYFLKRGAAIDGVSGSKTPLFYGIKYDKPAMVELLLESGADINVKSSGRSALEYAENYGRDNVIEVLKRYGAKVPPPPPLEDDGPYLTLEQDGSVTARWVRDAELKTQRFGPHDAVDLPEFAGLLGRGFDPRVAPQPTSALWAQPAKVLAISDVEGSYDDVVRFLVANRVIDGAGAWTFADAHLVCVGDFVDRGSQVTETLWLFHRLSREAQASGGRVHFLLGNHEAMLLGGDVRYTPAKYKHLAKAMGIRTEGLVGENTVLGRWLRSCNSIIRIGETVFVHAGLSPAIAAESLDYEAINAGIRSVAGQPRKEIKEAALAELAWGRSGPLWYRGYFEAHAESYGPVPTTAELDQVLKSAEAARIVVGHTKVKEVTSMFDGRVIAMDIPWTYPDKVQGLLFEHDGIELVDIKGESQSFLVPVAVK